jgi:uncharacterized membrane protein YfcA
LQIRVERPDPDDVPMSWSTAALSLLSGLLVAVLTTPVGVSGAVFLLPIQLSVLGVPSPSVTPTNLLFNVVATPGALLRYRRRGTLVTPLTRLLLLGTLPGVVIGAVVRVFAVPGAQVFRLIIAAVLLPLGSWLCLRTVRPVRHRQPAADPSGWTVGALALVVGVIGGIYGIGGGSILGPVLVGRGLPVAAVAPAALSATFLTSVAGAVTFALLALGTDTDAGPDWAVGVLCGVGGLAGGYLGAHLQPRLPEPALRLLLGTLAIAVAALYVTQILT